MAASEATSSADNCLMGAAAAAPGGVRQVSCAGSGGACVFAFGIPVGTSPLVLNAIGAEQVRRNLFRIAAGPAADGLNIVLRLVFRRRSVLVHDLAQRLAPIGRADQIVQRAPAGARSIEMQIAGRRARVRE